jgi:hypothetical protein
LGAKPKTPKAVRAAWPKDRDGDLRALLHQSPRTFGKPTGLWALPLAAQVCHEKGWTPRVLSGESIRRVLKRLGVAWERAKFWMTSPDPRYAEKKARRDRLIAPAAKHPNDTGRIIVRFVEGRPVGDLAIQSLSWACDVVAQEGKRVLIVVWDEASWHRADAVSGWVRGRNAHARQAGGVKLVICELPVASPWLNNIEPCWTRAKKAIMEPGRKLTAQESTSRACDHFGCQLLPSLRSQDAAEGAEGAPLHTGP